MARKHHQQFLFPELAYYEDEQQAASGLKAAKEDMPNRFAAFILLGMMLVAIASAIINLAWWTVGHIIKMPVLDGLPFWLNFLLQELQLAIVIPLGAIGTHYLYRKPIRQNLRVQLRKKGILLCINCGYNLCDQTERRCPECRTYYRPIAAEELEMRG